MNKCTKCGAETVGSFCPNCGSPVMPQQAPQPTPQQAPQPTPQPAPRPAPQPVRSEPVHTVNNYIHQTVITEEDLPAKFKPVGTWGYFWLKLLYSVPIVGFVFLIIHSFSNSNINRRNHARSYWCAYIILLIVLIIAFIILLIISIVTGASILELVKLNSSSY